MSDARAASPMEAGRRGLGTEHRLAFMHCLAPAHEAPSTFGLGLVRTVKLREKSEVVQYQHLSQAANRTVQSRGERDVTSMRLLSEAPRTQLQDASHRVTPLDDNPTIMSLSNVKLYRGRWRGYSSLMIVCLLPVMLACRGAGDRSEGNLSSASTAENGPVVRALGKIDLAETDSEFIGRPMSLAIRSDGAILVTDALSPRVAVYGRSGDPIGTIGRRGSGPGEFLNPVATAERGDSVLLVADYGSLRLEAFDSRTDSVLWERRFPSQTWSLAAAGGRIVIGFHSGAGLGSFAVLRGADDSLVVEGPTHDLFRRIPAAASVFGTVAVLVLGDTVWTTHEVSNHVYRNVFGQTMDSVDVAVRRRRGARIDLFRSMTTREDAAEAAYQSSVPLSLARLSSGMLVAVTIDLNLVNSRLTGEVHLSVVDFANHRSCVDALLPLPVDPMPRLTMKGDTLFALVQEVGEAARPLTTVRMYTVDVATCRWLREDNSSE